MEDDAQPVTPRRLLVGTLVRLGAIREVDVDALAAWTEDGRADRLGVGFNSIEWSNRVAELSIAIPDPSRWGQGYGTEAISLTT